MPQDDIIEVTGRIGNVFAHRFVIHTTDGNVMLADLGPNSAGVFVLETGAEVVLAGEMRPSELKVVRIALKGHTPTIIEHKPKPHETRQGPDAKPDTAVQGVRRAGFEPLGVPRRKPKHFEVLGRSGQAYLECQVEFDGRIRKIKIVSSRDPKWIGDISAAA